MLYSIYFNLLKIHNEKIFKVTVCSYIMQKRKSMTNHQYIHGDYDNDGVPNIDDRRPFDKTKKEKVNKEISLSKTFRYVESKRRAAAKVAKPIAKRHGMKYRIKGTYSIINKAVRSNPQVSGDMIGLRAEAKKRIEAKKKWQEFNKIQKVPNKGQDNKYKTLMGSTNPYRAFHSDFSIGGFGAEAQFRTKKFGKLNDNMHIVHKNKGNTKKFLPKSKKLVKGGY